MLFLQPESFVNSNKISFIHTVALGLMYVGALQSFFRTNMGELTEMMGRLGAANIQPRPSPRRRDFNWESVDLETPRSQIQSSMTPWQVPTHSDSSVEP